MATIINNPAPAPASNSNGPIGLIIGVVVLLTLGYFGYFYGLPALRKIQLGGLGGAQITVPTSVNVPSQIDVTVHQDK
jgi:hypothetical protein